MFGECVRHEGWIGGKSKAGGHSNDKKSCPLFRAESQPLRPRCRKEPGSGAFNRGLSTYKTVVTPNRDDKQNMSAKARSRKLNTTMLTKFNCVVQDDETYVKEDFKQLPGQEFSTATGRGKVADIFKHIKLSKFTKTYLV